jgi:hypothetical protein
MNVIIPRTITVPRQFWGMARSFRDRMLAAENVSAPEINRLSVLVGVQNPREKLLGAIERRWGAIPNDALLALTIKRDRGKMTILDFRLGAVRILHIPEHGDVDQLAVTIKMITVDITRECSDFSAVAVADVSLHALGRFYERARPADDNEVKEALWQLIAKAPKSIAEMGPFEIPVGEHGRWTGIFRPYEDRNGAPGITLNVKTYLD